MINLRKNFKYLWLVLGHQTARIELNSPTTRSCEIYGGQPTEWAARGPIRSNPEPILICPFSLKTSPPRSYKLMPVLKLKFLTCWTVTVPGPTQTPSPLVPPTISQDTLMVCVPGVKLDT